MNASLRFATFVASWIVLALVPVSAYAEMKIAVIDINHIFKNHTRFKAMVESWKAEVKRAEAEMKGRGSQVEKMVEDLKRYNPGTPEYKRLEEAIAKKRGELQVEMQLKKKDLMLREARMYLNVYEEVQQQVATFAQQNSIDLVLRFSRNKVNAEDPRQIQAALLRPVVYQDRIDITVQILQRLNPPPTGQLGNPPRGRTAPRRQ